MQKQNLDNSWSFLVASPRYSDSVFEESVILLLEDSPEGSFGIIINRDTSKTLSELSPEFKNTVLENAEVFDGGPVCREKVSVAVYAPQNDETAGFSFSMDTAQIEKILKKYPDAKIAAFSGYTGWGPGQLKREIEEGTWFLCDVDVPMMVNTDTSLIWRELVLKSYPQYAKLPKPVNDADLN